MDRVALITGGGRGIGRAIARALAAEGASVAIAGRTERELIAVADALRAEGKRALPIRCDVTIAADVERAVAETRQLFGPIDIVIPNAGIAESAKLEETTDDLVRRHLEVNLLGVLRLVRSALPDLLARRRGRVVVVASTAAKIGFAYTSAYAASKHALLGFVRSWALELATRGVTVNAVCPGWTETEMAEATIARISDRTARSAEEARALLAGQSPQRRLMTGEEVAALVLFLCQDVAAGIHGQAINVCGGMVMG